MSSVTDNNFLATGMDRIDKIPSPLLVIGLGGTGDKIVRTIKEKFASRYKLPKNDKNQEMPAPDRTSYLVIDSSEKTGIGLDVNEFLNISVVGLENILKTKEVNLTADEREWVNKNLNAASNGMGAGTNRQASRIMLSRNFSKVETTIKNLLTRISTVQLGTNQIPGRIEIVIAAGIGGGTGSGTFLDVAQIVRYIMSQSFAGQKFQITGYIALPDITLDELQNNPAMMDIIKINSYAALKELDFWMSVKTHRTPYTMKYGGSNPISVEWTEPPFDHCTLLSGTNVQGTHYANPSDVMRNTIAENLLHYLAYEKPKHINDELKYTYIEYEDNLGRMVGTLSKALPLNYCYRAIGAYSKCVPKLELIFLEGSFLFEKFMPPYDNNGILVPDGRLLTDGQTSQRVNDIIQDINTNYNLFCQTNLYPEIFRDLSPRNKMQISMLQGMSPAPHDQYKISPLEWTETVIAPAALKAGEVYLNEVWNRFTTFCSGIIEDPDQGPFSLLRYLDDPKGLLVSFEKTEEDWKTFAQNFKNDIGSRYQACAQSYNDFVHPPVLIGKSSALQLYLDNLQNLLNSERLSLFMDQYYAAIQMFVKRVKDYRDRALRILCDTIEQLNKDMLAPQNSAAQLSGELFSVDTVKNNIVSTFNASNQNNQIVKSFLNQICSISFEAFKNPNKNECDLTFTFPMNPRGNVLVVLRDEMNTCYSHINGRSLDNIMISADNNTVADQNQYIDNICDGVLNSAIPLFKQDPTVASQAKAAYSYLSIPDDSPLFIQHLQTTAGAKGFEPKESSLRDHIYCTTAWDGLPLYRYDGLAALEEKYYHMLAENNPSNAGVHLVWNGDDSAEYTNNWKKLPSPRPYYFFGAQGDAEAVSQFENAKQFVKRAMAAGSMSMDISSQSPKYTFRSFQLANGLFKDPSQIKAEVTALMNRKDPVTGSTVDVNTQMEELKKMMDAASLQIINTGMFPDFMAANLNLTSQPLNPFDAQTAGNPASYELAQKNYRLLSKAYGAAVLLQNPRIYKYLRDQIEGFEAISQLLNKYLKQMNVWGPRLAFAPTFVNLMIFNVVRFTITGQPVFMNAQGAPAPIIQPQLMHENLQNKTPLVKAASYIADLDSQNPTRMQLDHDLNLLTKDWSNRALMGTLTREDMEKNKAALDALNERAVNELNQLLVQQQQNLQTDLELNKSIDLMRAITGEISTQLMNLKLNGIV